MIEFQNVGPPWWDDKPVIIIGGGNSLAGLDLDRLKDLGHVLAVKGTIFRIDWADAGFGLDLPRFGEWSKKLGKVPYPVYWAVPDTRPKWETPLSDNIKLIRRSRADSLSLDPSVIHNGGTSGFGALNLAVLKKAKQIVLFGYDYQPIDGSWHVDRSNYGGSRVQNPIRWKEWSTRYSFAAKQLTELGVEVVNASPNSLVPDFTRTTIDDAIADLHRLRSEGSGCLCSSPTFDPPQAYPTNSRQGDRIKRFTRQRHLR